MKFSFPRMLLWILVSGVLVTAVSAHGGGEIQLANAPIGPYKMTLWLNPPNPQAQQTMHITVGLAAPPNDAPMLDATIFIDVTNAATGNLVLTTPATTEASINRLFYETDFTLAEPGLYEVNTRISAPGGQGSAAFSVEVAPPNPTNWLVIGLAGLAMVVLFSLWRNRQRN